MQCECVAAPAPTSHQQYDLRLRVLELELLEEDKMHRRKPPPKPAAYRLGVADSQELGRQHHGDPSFGLEEPTGMHQEGRPGRGQPREANPLSERRCPRAFPNLSSMLLIAHERGVPDDRVHPRQARPYLVRARLVEEIPQLERPAESVTREEALSLEQRRPVDVDSKDSLPDVTPVDSESIELSRAREKERSFAAGRIQHPRVRPAGYPPPCQVVGNGERCEESPTLLA